MGSVDEDGVAVRMVPIEINRCARDHILFLVEGEGFLGGHVLAEVAALQFEEDAELGVAGGSVRMPTPKIHINSSTFDLVVIVTLAFLLRKSKS